MYLECNAKGVFAIALLGKQLEFYTEICVYFNYLISKCSLFIGSMSCPNQTKLGMGYPMCTLSVMQKEFLL